jgi:hypothetical protein
MNSPFIQAIIDNDIGKVESLIHRHKRQQQTKTFPYKLNVVGAYAFDGYIIDRGDHPLHVAARCGHINIIKLLVKQGAQINRRNKRGETALVAALSNYTSNNSINITNTIKTLLNLGSSLQGDESNTTPLHLATYHSLESVIKLLIEKDKTTIYSMDNDRVTPVDFAIACAKSIMDIYYHTDPDILIANKSLLHRAVWDGKDGMIKHMFWLGLPVSYLERKIKCHGGPIPAGNRPTSLKPIQLVREYYKDKRIPALLLALGAGPDVRHKYELHTEDEVAAIRYDCFFSRSLVSRLLPFCTKS